MLRFFASCRPWPVFALTGEAALLFLFLSIVSHKQGGKDCHPVMQSIDRDSGWLRKSFVYTAGQEWRYTRVAGNPLQATAFGRFPLFAEKPRRFAALAVAPFVSKVKMPLL